VRIPPLIGQLTQSHRARVEGIVRATGVFSDAEVAVAVELFEEAFAEAAPVNEARDATRDHSSSAGDPSYLFLGAFAEEGDLLGYACYGPTPGTDGTHDLYWIAVDPAAQGSGAGTALLDEVERRLRSAGGRLVVVETSGRPAYAPTRAFYHARGYAEAAPPRPAPRPGPPGRPAWPGLPQAARAPRALGLTARTRAASQPVRVTSRDSSLSTV
jgi:ribosomal protein S18 acetylase RimI-like enzyme